MLDERYSGEVSPQSGLSEGWQFRSAACELLSLSFRYPEDSTLASAIVTGEWTEAVEEIAGALDISLPQGFYRDIAHLSENADGVAVDLEAFSHVLRSEATRLFIGTHAPVVAPYEGIRRSADEGVEGLLFVNPHSMDVKRFCNACGLDNPAGKNEPLDHVATELELLEYLSALAAGIIVAPQGGPAPETFPGGSPEGAYDLFMHEHARTWLPGFAEQVAQASCIPFYRAAAMLLAAFVNSSDRDC